MRKYIPAFAAACFLVAGVLWAYKINFMDKPVVPYSTPQLTGEVQVAAPVTGQLVIDGGRIVQIRWGVGNNGYTPFLINIPIGNEPLTSIRFDPAVEGSGVLRFRHLRFIDSKGNATAITPADWDSLNARADIKIDGDVLVITRQLPEHYPVLLLKIPGPLDTAVDGYPRITRMGFWSVLSLCAMFAIVLLQVIVKIWWKAPIKERFIFGGCFLLLIGIRGLTIHHFGFSSAFWDYWQFPWTVYFPFEDGNLSWRSIFAPFNEHRIFFSRISSLACYLVNGQWDNKFESMLNSFFLSWCAWGLALALWRACGRRYALLISASCVVCFAFPFSWENTVWANQSCFFFFLGGSLLVFWLLGLNKPFSVQWWLGCSVAFWIMFTVGSGILAVVTVAGLMVYRLLRHPGCWYQALPTLVASLVLSGLNYPFLVHQHNYGMKTKTLDQFIVTFGKTMSWPFINCTWLWVVLWVPVVVLFVMAFRSRQRPDRLELWVTLLSGWSLLNTLGVAVYRGGFSSGPASRYMDLSAVAALSGLLALVWLWKRGLFGHFFARMAAMTWCVIMGYGILAVTAGELTTTLAMRMERQKRSIQNVMAFLRSDSVAFLMNPSDEELPHPDRMGLTAYLRSTRMQIILPSIIRKPLRMEIESMAEFDSPGIEPPLLMDRVEPSWGSYGRRGHLTTGRLNARLLDPLNFPWLEFPVVHRLGGAFDTSLSVKDPVRGKGRSVSSMPEPYAGWRPLLVRAPARHNLKIEARDNDSVAWFAFRAPREKSTLSVLSDGMLARSLWLVWGGIVLMAIGVATSGGVSSNYLFSSDSTTSQIKSMSDSFNDWLFGRKKPRS
jgi:hypothetical protein